MSGPSNAANSSGKAKIHLQLHIWTTARRTSVSLRPDREKTKVACRRDGRRSLRRKASEPWVAQASSIVSLGFTGYRQRIRAAAARGRLRATTLIAIDITLAALFWSWSGDDDIIARLVKKTLFVGVFAYLIGNWNNLARIIFESFSGLGLKAAGIESVGRRLPAPRPRRPGRARRRPAAYSIRSPA